MSTAGKSGDRGSVLFRGLDDLRNNFGGDKRADRVVNQHNVIWISGRKVR